METCKNTPLYPHGTDPVSKHLQMPESVPPAFLLEMAQNLLITYACPSVDLNISKLFIIPNTELRAVTPYCLENIKKNNYEYDNKGDFFLLI